MKYTNAHDFTQGLAAISNYMECRYIGRDGSVRIPFVYRSTDGFLNGYARVMVRKWGYIDFDGNEVIPTQYDFAETFSEGLFKVRLAKKWGFVNHENQVVIPLIYDMVGNFKNGLCMVKLGSGYGYIDKAHTQYWED